MACWRRASLLLAVALATPDGFQTDGFHDVLDLVKPYPLELHYVTTLDGYVLSLYRIPHGLGSRGGATSSSNASSVTSSSNTSSASSGSSRPQWRQLVAGSRGSSSSSSRKQLRPREWPDGGGGDGVGGGGSGEDAGQAGRASSRRGGGGSSSDGSNGSSSGGGSGNPHIGKHGRPVVLLQHGLLDSCAGFLLSGQDTALAFLLADEGFDVWLGNSRGSTYSRAHTHLPLLSREFWAFSYDEMAKFDLPALLGHIRETTGARRVQYVGHSQGTTSILAALSPASATKASHLFYEGRSTNSKGGGSSSSGSSSSSSSSNSSSSSSSSSAAFSERIASQLGLVVLLAPVATARHVTSVPLQALALAGTDTIFATIGVLEFLPSVELISWLEGGLCSTRPELCVSILAAICGYRKGAVDEDRLPLYLKYTPAGTSVHNMAHWAQNVRGTPTPSRPTFAAFDYGTDCGLWMRQNTCNQQQYNSSEPPIYQLADMPRVKFSVFTGGMDKLANPIDTAVLLSKLPPGAVVSHTHLPEFEHLDLIWAMEARAKVYEPLLSQLLDAVAEGGR